jgi:Flp pilus assembly protein TadG
MRVRSTHRDERGATIVLAALAMVALLGLTGLVIDGGRAYSDHRQAQNAADAAALAGAGALNTYWTNPLKTAGDIWSAVLSKTQGNATNNTPSCHYVDSTGAIINSAIQCSAYVGRTVPLNATGVEVHASDTQNSAFVQVLGIKTFSAGGTAQARVRAVNIGKSPILLCAVSGADPRSVNGQGIDENDPLLPPIFLPGTDTINPLAIYNATTNSPIYQLKGVEVKKKCGTSANFKGRVEGDGDVSYPIPGPWPGDNGNSAGPFRTKLAGDCNGETVGCKVLIPLCYGVAPAGQPPVDPDDDELWCPAMGIFVITSFDSNSDSGGFLGTAPILDGGSGGGQPGTLDQRVITLTK